MKQPRPSDDDGQCSDSNFEEIQTQRDTAATAESASSPR
jgi:hypothetical protein